MRTGADYRESLRDGRDVWVLGEGAVADVTTHPATSAMVGEYAAWYDRHFDPEWQDILLAPPGQDGQRRPLALTPPKTSDDLRRMGKALSAVHFITGGNMTHTAGYGHLIALGMVNALKRVNHSAEEIAAAEEYLESLRRTGRFLTFAGGGPLIGARLREDESQRAALRLVSETADGIVLSGKVQMHTSTPFAEDLLITSRDELPPGSGRNLWFIAPVNAPGLRVVSRRAAARHPNRFMSPLSSRFDELDSMVWLEDVFIPRSRVFTGETIDRNRRHSLVCWLLWHHSYGWLAKAELTLAIALALAEVMGLKHNPQTIEAAHRADRQHPNYAHLHDGGGARPGSDFERPCPAQPAPRGLCGHQHPQGAAEDVGNPARPPRLVAGQRARRHRLRRPRDGRRAGGRL